MLHVCFGIQKVIKRFLIIQSQETGKLSVQMKNLQEQECLHQFIMMS